MLTAEAQGCIIIAYSNKNKNRKKYVFNRY